MRGARRDSRAFEQLLDELLATFAAEGINVPRDLLRVKLPAVAWHAVIFDEGGCFRELVTGLEVEWPPLAN